MKRCQSCGRLIELLEDFAGLDQSGIYCSSCGDDRGNLKSFEEVLDNLTQRIAKTDGFDESASRNAALQILGRQPAWEPRFKREENVNNNKRKLILALVAIVFALSAGGAAWWITSRYYQNKENPYVLHMANYEDPFKDIRTSNVNGFEITELRCRGDQRVTELENGVLKFESFQKSWDYSNLETKNLINNSVNQNSSISNEGTILNQYQIVDTNAFEYNIVSKEHALIDKSPPMIKLSKFSRFFAQGVNTYSNVWLDDTYDDDLPPSILNSIGDDFCFYDNKSIRVVSYPRKNNVYGLEEYLYILRDNEIKFKLSLRDTTIEKLGITENYVIFKIYKGLFPNEKKYFMVLDVDLFKYEMMPATFLTFQCISGKSKYIYRDKNDDLYEYDFVNKKSEKMCSLYEGYDVVSIFDKDQRKYLFLSGNNEYKDIDAEYYYMDLQSQKINKIDVPVNTNCTIIGPNMIILAPCRGMYVYSTISSKYSVAFRRFIIGRIELKDVISGKSTIIDENVLIDDNLRGYYFDGTYLAWTKYAGSKDDQWKNVCYTKIPGSK